MHKFRSDWTACLHDLACLVFHDFKLKSHTCCFATDAELFPDWNSIILQIIKTQCNVPMHKMCKWSFTKLQLMPFKCLHLVFSLFFFIFTPRLFVLAYFPVGCAETAVSRKSVKDRTPKKDLILRGGRDLWQNYPSLWRGFADISIKISVPSFFMAFWCLKEMGVNLIKAASIWLEASGTVPLYF